MFEDSVKGLWSAREASSVLRSFRIQTNITLIGITISEERRVPLETTADLIFPDLTSVMDLKGLPLER